MNVNEPYDAIVIGSGAAGGIAIWRLAQAGLRVAPFEAGPWYDPEWPVKCIDQSRHDIIATREDDMNLTS